MPKVTKNLTNLRKKFCEFPPRVETILRDIFAYKKILISPKFRGCALFQIKLIYCDYII